MSFHDDVAAMVAGCTEAFGVPITVYPVTEGAFDTTTMKRGRTRGAGVEVMAIRDERVVERVGNTRVREVTYRVARAALPAEPAAGWEVVEGAETVVVSSVGESAAGAERSLVCRRTQ